MKKLLLLFILLCFISPAFAKIDPPMWEEFCPPQYISAEYDDYKSKIHPAVNMLMTVSIIGLPWAIKDGNKVINAKTTNYWVERRNEFEKSINEVRTIKNETELIYKYLSIRQNEIAKNQQRDMWLQEERLTRELRYQSNQFRNQQIPINSYFRYGY